MKHAILILLFLSVICASPLTVHTDEGISGVISVSKDAVVAIVGRAENNKFVVLGSGFFVTENGTIATCDHVAKQVPKIFVMKSSDLETSNLLGYITTKDKLPQLNLPVYQATNTKAFIPAKILDRSEEFDVALLQTEEKSPSYLGIGKYDSIEEGNDLIFLGFPFGFNRVVTHKGMVSYKGQINITAFPGGKSIRAVQIDGIVNRGISGGPLISTSQGKVVGIVKASHGNVGPYLQAINEGKIGAEGLSLGQIDFGVFTREVSSAIDRHIQMGIGYAISSEYLAEMLNKAQVSSSKKKGK